MQEFTFTVKDPSGIHARPAGILVKEASKYKSDITVKHNDKVADAKRIFSVMGIGAKCGDILTITINGEDEIDAKANIENLLTEYL